MPRAIIKIRKDANKYRNREAHMHTACKYIYIIYTCKRRPQAYARASDLYAGFVLRNGMPDSSRRIVAALHGNNIPLSLCREGWYAYIYAHTRARDTPFVATWRRSFFGAGRREGESFEFGEWKYLSCAKWAVTCREGLERRISGKVVSSFLSERLNSNRLF